MMMLMRNDEDEEDHAFSLGVVVDTSDASMQWRRQQRRRMELWSVLLVVLYGVYMVQFSSFASTRTLSSSSPWSNLPRLSHNHKDTPPQVQQSDPNANITILSTYPGKRKKTGMTRHDDNDADKIPLSPSSQQQQQQQSTTTTTTSSVAPTTSTPTTTPTDLPSVPAPPPTTPTSNPTSHPTSNGPIDELPDDLRICRLNDPAPILGERPVVVENATHTSLNMVNMTFRYQCAGPAYDTFIQTYQYPFVLKRHWKIPTWGTRPTPIPPPTASGVAKILIVGNSHTRQMASAFLCQYSDYIQWSRDLLPQANYVHAMEYLLEFPQQGDDDDTSPFQLTLYIVINHPFAYSDLWQSNLEFVLNQPIHDLTAIVFGSCNQYSSKHKNANMWVDIRNYANAYPNQQIQPAQHSKGIVMADLTPVFVKPVIFISMLANSNDWEYRAARNHVKNDLARDQNRTNCRAIDARHYIKLQAYHECGSDENHKVDTCIQDMMSRSYRNAHRCMGDKGGQPDLVAWDVIEALWEVLSE